MNILFLSYWNAQDPLTTATVLPHLELLNAFDQVRSIIWVNIEREEKVPLPALPKNIKHIPYLSASVQWGVWGQALDFVHAPRLLNKLCQKENIQWIIARGSPAGALVINLGVPFMVESFEPHADYMRYSGTWKPWGLKYLLQKRWEQLQKQQAQWICPVSENYRQALIKEGVPAAKLKVLPCEVNTNKISYKSEARQHLREVWAWQQAVVGVYAGKFGGLYEDEKAFELFKLAHDFWGDRFRLLLLSSESPTKVQLRLQEYQIPSEQVKHSFVPHDEMADYLSVADFAFALYKTNEVSTALSPIKVGEYWAIGLPVLIAKNIGDDSTIIQEENIGAIYAKTIESKKLAIKQLNEIVQLPNLREKIQTQAHRYRSNQALKEMYAQLLDK